MSVMGTKRGRVIELEKQLKIALEEIERLKAENAALKARIAQLEKTSLNSSKPPSSDIVNPPKEQKSEGKRKIGAQFGHKQHLRQPFIENQVDNTIQLTLNACPKCGGELQAVDEPPKKHQQVELVEKPFIVTEYHQLRYWCDHCKCYHESKLPLETKNAGLFGQNLIALTAYLKGRCHMSYKTIQSFFADTLGLKVSTGFLADQVQMVSEALKEPYQELVESLPKEKHIHSDETGGKENGMRCWIWCFRGKDYTVFHIAPSRGSVVLEKHLGNDYDGIISSDFFSAYKKFGRESNAKHQFCWSHLIREVRFIAENTDKKVSNWGNRLLEQICIMFSTIHLQDIMKEEEWHSQMLSHQESILKAARCRVPVNQDAQNISIRMREYGNDYFRFIDNDIPPTNNLCEQSIRQVVIDRKITQGTRSDWGNRWCERIWSILSTCEQRGKNVMLFLRSSVGSFLQGYSPPSLLNK